MQFFLEFTCTCTHIHIDIDARSYTTRALVSPPLTKLAVTCEFVVFREPQEKTRISNIKTMTFPPNSIVACAPIRYKGFHRRTREIFCEMFAKLGRFKVRKCFVKCVIIVLYRTVSIRKSYCSFISLLFIHFQNQTFRKFDRL